MENDKKPRLKSNVRIIINIFLVVFLIVPIIFLILIFKGRFETINISHSETSKIDYKAYLDEDSMFEVKYRLPGETIITSIIDYIDTDFSYEDAFLVPVSGTFDYYVRATIYANKSNSETNYWTSPEYILVKNVNKKVNTEQVISINQNVKINYNDFNNKLNEFKKEYPLSIDGYILVELMVKKDLSYDYKTDYKPVSTMKIPLSELVIEVSIDTKGINNSNIIKTETLLKKGILYKLALPLIILLSIIVIVIIIRTIIFIKKQDQKYTTQINKILSTYSGIIIKVNNLPHIGNIDIIDVCSIDDLIDAQSEVRQPINYYEDKENKRSYFVLSNGNMAWKYVIKAKVRKKKH